MDIEEAIVYFKNYIKVKKEVIRERKDEEGWIVDSRYTKQLEEMVEAFEIVLSELEKKEKELEEAKRETQQVLDDYQDLGKEKYKLECEAEKKDKIIDLMAKELYVEGYCKNINCKKCNANKFWECIKQYFTNKVEKEGK